MKKLLIFSFLFICTTAFTQELLSPEKLWELNRVGSIATSPDGSTLLFTVSSYNLTQNKGNTQILSINLLNNNIDTLTAGTFSNFDPQWRPDGLKIGYMSTKTGSAQMWEMNPDGSNPIQVTTIPDGFEGFKYAPDLKRILFVKETRIDPSLDMIYPDLPLANARITDDLMYRHWDTWYDGMYRHVFYIAYNDGKIGNDPVDLLRDQPYNAPLSPFGGLEQVAWNHDGTAIAYTCKKLSGKEYAVSTNSDIYLYNIKARTTTNLTQGMMGYDVEPNFSPDGKYMAWLSMAKPGFEADKNRLFILNLADNSKRELTANVDMSAASVVWNGDSKKLFFIGGVEATYQVFEVDVETSQVTQVTTGDHNYLSVLPALKKKKDVLIATRQSMSAPTEVFMINKDKKVTTQEQISFTNKKQLKDMPMGKVEKRWMTTTDGKKMLTWVIYPPNFDPRKRYPTLLYCQGGPQSAVSQFFSYRWNFQLMAAKGYIVVAPNRRGLPSFGQDWNDEISGDWGGQAMKDYLTAIDEMAKEPFVDKDRLGAVGASYGGYSVYWLAGNHNNRFKTFISHCGLFNLESWYGSTEEMFFANHDIGGPYWKPENQEGYKKFSPHNFVQNWNTPILVIHGEQDFRVPIGEGLQAFNVAQLQGIKSRFLYFPEEGHWVLKPQNGVLWHREYFKWLEETLKN